MNKLQQLIEAAKEDANLRNPDALNGHGDTILELCALLEKAEEALETCDEGDYSTGHVIPPSFDEASVNQALAAIKQWKEQT